jgi:integrase
MRWLIQRGRTWYAVMEVPRPLRAKLGKRRLLKSLQTRDYHVAKSRRHAALAEFQRVFERARAAAGSDDLTTAALSWRDTLARLERGDTSAFWVGSDGPDPLDAALWVLEDEVGDIETYQGRQAADTFVGIARGTATPLLLHIDAWLREGGSKGSLAPRTIVQYRADLKAFAEWAASIGITTVEAVTEQTTGQFVTEQLVGKGVHWETANRKIRPASSYWRWLRKRAGVKANPWAGQSMSKGAGRNGDRSKRPFTDAEVAALIGGEADPELADAMRVAALSGMRVEEIYRLAVADCAGGWFDVRRAKTRAGVRRMPIHSNLAPIVARRCDAKKPTDFLFHEAGPTREGRERSMALSKRFGRYRQTLGIHEREAGARHSRVDFHSWRRWFVTKARNAGIDRAVVAAVVGHESGNLTDDVYSGGPAERLLRACVEAVRLPRGPRPAAPGKAAPAHQGGRKHMDDDRANFDRWFVRPLECLYPMDGSGVVLLYTAFPLLERYLTAATGDRARNGKFWSKLGGLFQQLDDPRVAKHFWDTYRKGLLHHGTFNSNTYGGSVVHRLGEVITLDAPTRIFCLGTVDFTQRVLARIVDDFPTYRRGPPLPAVKPIQTRAEEQHQPAPGITLGTSTAGPMGSFSPFSKKGP